MPRLRTALLAAVLVAHVLVGACSREVAGTPGPMDLLDPGSAAGLPVTEGPSGLRDGVDDADLAVDGADGSESDRIAADAVADLQRYWAERFPADFGTAFEPVARLVSFDSAENGEVCGAGTEGLVNAFYCPAEDTVAWDRGELLPRLTAEYGQMSTVTVLAHEVGHAVQDRLGLVDAATPAIVSEQQADCFAGSFLRHVAEGGSEHFTLSTGEGLNDVLAAVFAFRDPVGGVLVDPDAHGTAFDRVAAFQFGFRDGPRRCGGIDVAEVQGRATQLGFADGADESAGGDLPVDEETVRLVERSLRSAFTTRGEAVDPPEVVLGARPCAGTGATPPVSYCPDDGLVAVQLAGLAELGEPSEVGGGDFAAFAVLASRWVQSVQQDVELDLDDPRAGLRTACLVGAWAGVLLETPYGNRNPVDDPPLRISAGDLDEAVGELLRDGRIAADVDGDRVPSGFARVEAFRTGFLEGSAPCA